MLAPVFGLCPGRADQVFTVNAPKPRNSTRSRLAKAAPISSKMALTTATEAQAAQAGEAIPEDDIFQSRVCMNLSRLK